MAKDKKKASQTAEASSPEETKKSTKKTKPEKQAKQAKKKDGEKKKGNAVVRWFHDLGVEFRHVTWPSWHTVSINTGVVLSVIVAGSVIIGALDTGLFELLKFLIGLGQK